MQLWEDGGSSIGHSWMQTVACGLCSTGSDNRTRTVNGPRSFAVSGPTVWNTLPSTLRVSTTKLGQFQSGVKTILFRLAYGT